MLNNYIYTIICFILLSHSIFGQEEIAIVTKKNGDVKHKAESATLFKNKVNPGMELYNNDLLVTGNNGGKASKILTNNDIEICVPSNRTSRIQEMHLITIHAICECLDNHLSVTP